LVAGGEPQAVPPGWESGRTLSVEIAGALENPAEPITRRLSQHLRAKVAAPGGAPVHDIERIQRLGPSG